jgi:hypothetical protein
MFESPAASELAGCGLDLNVPEWGENISTVPNRRAKVYPRILNEFI